MVHLTIPYVFVHEAQVSPIDIPSFLPWCQVHSAEVGSSTLLGNEQTAVYLGMPGKGTKSPHILTSLTSGGHIDEWHLDLCNSFCHLKFDLVSWLPEKGIMFGPPLS